VENTFTPIDFRPNKMSKLKNKIDSLPLTRSLRCLWSNALFRVLSSSHIIPDSPPAPRKTVYHSIAPKGCWTEALRPSRPSDQPRQGRNALAWDASPRFSSTTAKQSQVMAKRRVVCFPMRMDPIEPQLVGIPAKGLHASAWRMLSQGPLASGPRGCGSMKFTGVGYLFTRRLRGAATGPGPDGTGQGCAGPTGPSHAADRY
jgi:hypothetical protein